MSESIFELPFVLAGAVIVGTVRLGAGVVRGGVRAVTAGIEAIGNMTDEHRRRRNRRIVEEKNQTKKNTLRLEKQLDEMYAATQRSIKESNEKAMQESQRRIARLEEESKIRQMKMQQQMESQIVGMQKETRIKLEEMRRQQNTAISNLEHQVYTDMSRMNEHLNRRIDTLAENIDHIESNMNRRIEALAGNMRAVEENLNQRIDVVGRNVDIVAKGLNQLVGYIGEMEKGINQRFEQQSREISEVRNRIGDIERRIASDDARGVERRKVALAWMAQLEATGDLDRYVPDAAAELRRRLDDLRAMSENDRALSAMAKDAILRVQQLEIDCTRERLRYQQMHEATLSLLSALMETVHRMRLIPLTDDEGNACQQETDFWTRGQYGELKKQLDELYREMDGSPSFDRMKEIMEEVSKSEVALQDLCTTAIERVNLSQNRMQLISDVIDVMEEHHWEVVTEEGEEAIGYMGGEECENDFREDAFARLRNNRNEEITIIVEPEGNTMSFHVTNGEFSETRNMAVATEVGESLEAAGYNVNAPRCVSDTAIEGVDSAAQLSRKGAARERRKRMSLCR